jgi:hypothetical protein
MLGREIRLGAFTFIADDSAWLQEAPLDVEALPIRGVTHFRASSCGVLLRQPSTPYSSAPASSTLSTARRHKRSGRSRLQRWVRHAAARQASTPQIAAIEPAESLHGAFDSASDQSELPSECESSDPAAEVLMAGSHSPPGYGRGGHEVGGPSSGQPRKDEDILHIPIVGTSAEAQALEATRLRLEEMQKALDERTRQRPPVSTRHHRQLFPPADNLEVFRTPIQNVAAAAKIADSIQPSNSEAGRGLEQIRALLGAARQQNSAVSQSRNRIHSKSPRADTVQSAHSPGSPLRRRGGGYRDDRYQDQGRDQYAPRYHRDDRRRVPTPPRSGPYVPRHYDDRHPYGDERAPGFDARSVLVQNRVDRGRYNRDGYGRDFPSGSGAVVSGPECFSRAIRSAEVPPNYRLAAGVSKFTGESKPETWLDDYRVAVQIGGGNDYIAMKHLSLMLDGSARAWLNQLPPSSIYSWEELARVFVKTFEGTCRRPAGLTELQHCVQKPNETLRDYIQRWSTLHHTVEGVSEHQAVCAFKAGVKYRELYLKFGRTGDMSLGRMMEIAAKYANGEEEDRLRSGKGKAVDNDGGGNSGRKQKRKADGSAQAEAAALAAQGKGKAKPKGQFTQKKSKNQSTDILDMPCPIHTRKDEDGNQILPKHTARQCRLLIQGFKEDQSSEKNKEKEDDDEEKDNFPEINATLVIFADIESKSRLKVINREVNMAVPATPAYLKWSQMPITFDQSDHPAHVPTPGRQALVVDPVVGGTRLRKVLMDGGSGLNILYADTLQGMGIPMSRLSESNMQFHGVIPGKKAKSLGQIALDVVFGNDKNFRKEKLTFEVVDFKSAYHAILGRPAYARFMARPCYVYLKLKMPGPKGVITVTGNRQRAEECLQQGSKIADQQMAVVELEEYKKTADPAELLRAKKPATESAFQSAGEVKPVHIHPTDPNAAPTQISTTLDSK